MVCHNFFMRKFVPFLYILKIDVKDTYFDFILNQILLILPYKKKYMTKSTYFLTFCFCFLFLHKINAQKNSFEQKQFETSNYILTYPQTKKFTNKKLSNWIDTEIIKKIKSLTEDNIFDQKIGRFKEESGSTTIIYEIGYHSQDTLSIIFSMQYLGLSFNYSTHGLTLDLKNKQVIVLEDLLKDKKQKFPTFAQKYIRTSRDCQLEEDFEPYDFTINNKAYIFYLSEANFSGRRTCLDFTSFTIPKNDVYLFLKSK